METIKSPLVSLSKQTIVSTAALAILLSGCQDIRSQLEAEIFSVSFGNIEDSAPIQIIIHYTTSSIELCEDSKVKFTFDNGEEFQPYIDGNIADCNFYRDFYDNDGYLAINKVYSFNINGPTTGDTEEDYWGDFHGFVFNADLGVNSLISNRFLIECDGECELQTNTF